MSRQPAGPILAADPDEHGLRSDNPPRQSLLEDEGGDQNSRCLPQSQSRNLGITHDLKGYDFTIQAINLNQAKEGSETA